MTTSANPIGRILIKDARLAFPNLFEATTVNGEGAPRYSATLILPADHPQLEEIRAKQIAVAKAKWLDKAPAIMKGLDKQDRLALHDGDVKAKYDGFAGNFFIAASAQENKPPTVVDRDRSPLSARSGRPYAGCFVNASIELWVQDNAYGQRINAQLRGVQFLRDGDSFGSGGGAASADEFEALEVEDDFA